MMSFLRKSRDALADSDVFGALGDAELEKLLGFAVMQRAPAAHIIFQKGDPGDSLFVIISGRIKIGTATADGGEAVLRYLGPGQTFGELALFDGKPRSADAVASEPSELCVLRRADVCGFLESHPEMAMRIIGLLCSRLRSTTEQLEDAMLHAMPSRIARGLLRLASEHGRRVPEGVRLEFRLPQSELACLVGIRRENVNRHLSAWRQANIIAETDGHLVIRDPDRLREIADAA